MKRFLKWVAIAFSLLFVAAFIYLTQILGPKIDSRMNAVIPHDPYPVSAAAQTLHDELWIADLHTDSLLWRRNPAKRQDRGHVDLPRLREGGVEFQIFSAVTKSPKGQNFDGNDANAPDQITQLVQAQFWPLRTWDSLYERAAYQAQRLQRLERKGEVHIVRTAADMDKTDRVLALLLTEGSHPLHGDLEKIHRLYREGYRAMGLHHFFDNELGGSLHGRSQAGLSGFGRVAVLEMREKGIIIDVAHSSVQTVRDVLALTPDPIFISHGGTVASCPKTKNRNLPDDVLQQIAARGGLIGIGYFDGVICDITPDGIADAIIDAAVLLGPDAVALGSDYDGTVTVTLDTSELAAITDALMRRGMNKENIRKVMGENARRFFKENLPKE
ncbi:dipeptidase [Litorimonas cladophorae]|uniref:Dipeptidase n=1 Tax=Litorimonas cladophorae TaxID=1220491 RepID=A0A918KL39_9PROT|nr:membrane dipeptidase [Litorimonas cladophorae]GGX65677.1 dipeptidase [Litorimonas cladophorae]